MKRKFTYALLASLTLGCVAFAQSGNSFTHLRSIPADADPSTIKLERVKAVTVTTSAGYKVVAREDAEQQFRDPGGSMQWPGKQNESRVPAYEVTFSFRGQPLSSDDSGSRYSTFSVYFRPEELPSALRAALTSGRPSRSTLAAYFKVTAAREPSRRTVIDQANSKLCDGNFVDGSWVRTDAHCQDQINLSAQTVLSDTLTLSVSAVAPVATASNTH